MDFLASLIVIIVAVLHLYFMLLEMFLWTKPLGLKVFRQSLDQARKSATLAANQGLYNGFLAAGLIWGMMESDSLYSKKIKIFFLGCITVAGFYGGWSINKKIIFIQACPALIGIVLQFVSM